MGTRKALYELDQGILPKNQCAAKPILLLSGVRGDTRRYRTFHPYEQLTLAGAPCRLSHLTDRRVRQAVDEAGVVVLHRVTWDPFVQQLIDSIHHRGGIALLDTDDLTFDPAAFQWIASPDFADPVRAALYQEDMVRNRRTAELCDGALTSTRFLAGEVARLGKPAWVHRNAFSLEMLAYAEQVYQQRQKHPGRVVLGYASGTPTHDRDFESIKTALQRTLRRFPQAELWLVGPVRAGSGWEALEGRIRILPLVPWRRLPSILAQFDLNLAPLVVDNPFAQSKSEIKYMEAALVRVPTLASPTEAFADAIRPGQTGFLPGSGEQWEEALEKLVMDRELRETTGENAYRQVLATYHPYVRAVELIRTLNLATQTLRGSTWLPEVSSITPLDDAPWLSLDVEAHPTLTEMAGYTLRRRGLRTLIKQEWIFFRRMLAPIFPYGRFEKATPVSDVRQSNP